MARQDRNITEALRRCDGDKAIEAAIAEVSPSYPFTTTISWAEILSSIQGACSDALAQANAVFSKVLPSGVAKPSMQQALTKAVQYMDEGEDPVGSATTTSATQDLRDAVDGASTPAYSGDAQNDRLADIFKYLVDQQIA